MDSDDRHRFEHNTMRLQIWIIGRGEPWVPEFVIIGSHEDAAAAAAKSSGSYIGPMPFAVKSKCV